MILAKKWVCVAPYYLMCLFLPFSDIFNPCSLARVSPVCPEFFGAERKGGQHFFVCVFVFCLFFSGPWPPDSLGICSAIIWERERERERAHLIFACHALSFRRKKKQKKKNDDLCSPGWARQSPLLPSLTGHNSESSREMKTTSGFYSEAKRLAAATAKKHKTKEGQKNGKCWIQDFFFFLFGA